VTTIPPLGSYTGNGLLDIGLFGAQWLMQRCDYCFHVAVDEASQTCAHCGTPQRADRPFGATRTLAARPSTYNLVLRNQHNGLLKENDIALYLTDRKEPVIALLDDQLIFGRFPKGVDVEYAAFDLIPFHAVELGVSRAHALLQRYNQNVMIKDLGSTNGTWVNTTRIPAQNLVRLENGDRVVLGRLSMYVYFE
jgi:ribosomal protein L37E